MARLLRGVSRRNWMVTTVRDRTARPAPDLVERNFAAAAPNRLWVADITYIPSWAGFSLSGRGARCVQPQDRRLGDGKLPTNRAGAQGA